jgi:putative nucleotidyltransferase with HDIG domain
MSLQEFHDKVIALQPVDLFQYVEEIPEFKLMADCQQSPPHHLEGSVLVHSQMASSVVLQLMEAEHIEKKENQIALYLSAILHDIGKPATYSIHPKKGTVTAYGHEKDGVWLAKEFLFKYFPEFKYPMRLQILNLIRYHMDARKNVTDGITINKLKMLSLVVNTKLLYLLSQADTLGRKAADMRTGMFALELFRQNCLDSGCWNKNYRIPLATHLDNASYSLARWNILVEDAPETIETLDEAKEIMGKPIPPFQILLLIGAPASGKTTVRNQLEKQYPQAKVISMDDQRKKLCGDINDQSRNNEIFGWQEHTLREAMKNRQSCIVDCTNPTFKLRKILFRIAREHGALCSAIFWDLPLKTLLERNANREKKVPETVVERFYKALEYIHPVEADSVRIIES